MLLPSIERVRVFVTDSLVSLAKVYLAEGRLDEAESELAEAVAIGERLGERVGLWKGLALTAGRRDAPRADPGHAA